MFAHRDRRITRSLCVCLGLLSLVPMPPKARQRPGATSCMRSIIPMVVCGNSHIPRIPCLPTTPAFRRRLVYVLAES